MWVANWRSVYFNIAYVLKSLLGEGQKESIINFKEYRERILNIIQQLLLHPDPKIRDIKEEQGSDPFSVAMNSVRGAGFEDFLLFAFRDGMKFSKETPVKISQDVKEIYEETLSSENTTALMFMFGYYLPSFYYRDKKWIIGLLSKILLKSREKTDLYIAALEGYLSASIYKEMFDELPELYERAIKLKKEDYPKRKYFRSIDKGLATHLALAYIHFPEFDLDSKLFHLFWDNLNKKRGKQFISFIGRDIISRDNASEFIKQENINIEKIKNLWDWLLKHIKDDELFSSFGFWANKENNVFDDSDWLTEHLIKTLERTNGKMDWDFGLIRSLPLLAKESPANTFKILELCLLKRYEHDPESFKNGIILIDDFIETFRILYSNNEMKPKIYDLINQLLEKGGSMFWKLEEVIT